MIKFTGEKFTIVSTVCWDWVNLRWDFGAIQKGYIDIGSID